MPKVKFISEISTGTILTITTMLLGLAGMWYDMTNKINLLEASTKNISEIVVKHDSKIDALRFSVIKLETKVGN